ncbi:MAG: TatD family hydrolase [Verrucomicrobiales bacterium]
MMIDAHNHLQDKRLDSFPNKVFTTSMVNGTCEDDWKHVAELAEKFPDQVIPNFGLHPWFVNERTENWEATLNKFLDRLPNAGVGEVGIDKWIRDHDIAVQQPIFETQICIAAEREIPLTIHCLRAFGRLKEILDRNPLPQAGFLLHSYSGPADLVEDFLKLGAYFSISGYFMHERKAAAREIFRRIPIERLLIETDAPDMPMPGSEIPNDPADIAPIYEFAAELRGMELADFETQIAENFGGFRRE